MLKRTRGLRRSIFVVLALLLGACSRGVDPAQCTEMLDRYVAMTTPGDSPAQKRLTPAYRRAEEQCAREVSKKEYACAMNAKSPNDWEACIE